MTYDALFDPDGPESRNRHAAAFEGQLESMVGTFGWRVVCRNVDVVLKKGEPSRGIDLLLALNNPWSSHVEGWLLEGKRKKDARKRYAATELRDEIQTLRDKVAGLRGSSRFYANDRVKRARIRTLAGGMLAHRSEDFPDAKVRTLFREFDLARNEEAGEPTRIAFLSPRTLVGIADAFNHVGLPRRFLWPPSAPQRKATWAQTCAPEQLAVGLLVYESVDKKKVMWVRGGLAQRDMSGFADLVWTLGINVDVVAFTDLNGDDRRTLAQAWRDVAAGCQERPKGRLPSDVVALDTQQTMKEFDQLWPAVAA
jgi:hypothetical protein